MILGSFALSETPISGEPDSGSPPTQIIAPLGIPSAEAFGSTRVRRRSPSTVNGHVNWLPIKPPFEDWIEGIEQDDEEALVLAFAIALDE